MSLIAGRGCRWPPRRDSVSPCAPLSGGRDTHDGHENSPILVFFSNLLGLYGDILRRWFRWIPFRSHVNRGKFSGEGNVGKGESNGTAHC